MQAFIAKLYTYKRFLDRQQIRTLRGQALAGDVAGAQKGLDRILWMRRCV